MFLNIEWKYKIMVNFINAKNLQYKIIINGKKNIDFINKMYCI